MPSDPHSEPRPQPLVPFDPVPVRPRRDGWTAQRQRIFIEALAETGCVVTACREAGMQARGAYRLAARPDGAAFAAAWDQALIVASRRLLAYAFEYSTHGVTETLTSKDGGVVAERRRPSERVLLYLLTHLDSHRFGRAATVHPNYRYMPDPSQARATLAALSDILEDVEDAEDDGDAALPPPGHGPGAAEGDFHA